jgi:hypothetical protein
MRIALLTLVIGLAACDVEKQTLEPNIPGDGSDTDTDLPGDTDAPCTNTLTSVSPADGATQVDTATVVEVGFNEPVVEGTWSVEIDGVSGLTSIDSTGLLVTYTPDEVLAFDTTYTINASVCAQSASASFDTAAEPLDISLLDGRTYELPYADLTWVKPNAISLLSSYIDFDAFIIQVDSIDVVAETLTVLSAVGYDNGGVTEPECSSLFSPGSADFSQNPTFLAGPSDMALPVGGTDLILEDFTLSANFNSDGTKIENITFSGLADTRALDSTVGNTCNLASFLGDTCVACNDGEVKCLEMEAEAAEALWNAGLDLAAECP